MRTDGKLIEWRVSRTAGIVLAAGACVAILALVLTRSAAVDSWWQALLHALSSLGGAAPVLFVLLYVLTCIFLLPGGPLTPAAGALFGVPLGVACVSLGSFVGACCAFGLMRRFGRGALLRRFGADPRALRLDTAIAREGWKIVLLMRLCPLIPFRTSNYLLGATGIRFRDFALATWIGALPTACFYVVLGHSIQAASSLNAAMRSPGAIPWYLLSTALLGLLLWYLSRLAHRTLADSLSTRPE